MIILAVALVAIFGAGFRNVVIAIAVAYIDDFARIVRGETLSLREQDFTMAARALGARDDEVMVRHIMPNLVAPLTVQLSFAVGLGILTESTLTFLGLGVNPATPTWGLAINEGRDFVRQAWWISVFPGLAIVITVMALNLLGDGLRDALDVRGVSDDGVPVRVRAASRGRGRTKSSLAPSERLAAGTPVITLSGKPQVSDSTPPATRRTHSPAWQPFAGHAGVQKWRRPQGRQ